MGGIWPCRDGLIEFIALTDKHWAGLVQLLGSPPELSDPAWPTRPAGGSAPRRSWPSSRRPSSAMGREDFVGRAQQLSVPCALVNTVGQFTQDPQPRSRGFFVRHRWPASGEFDVPGQPFVSGQPLLAQYRRPAPRLGEHDPAEIAARMAVGRRPQPRPAARCPGSR